MSILVSASLSRIDCCNIQPPEWTVRGGTWETTCSKCLCSYYTEISKRDHVTPMLLDMSCLPVKSRITFKTLLLTFKCLHGRAPPYLSAFLSPYCPTCTVYALLISYFLHSPLPELKSANDPSLMQLQRHGTHYPLQCTNVWVLIRVRLHSRHICL